MASVDWRIGIKYASITNVQEYKYTTQNTYSVLSRGTIPGPYTLKRGRWGRGCSTVLCCNEVVLDYITGGLHAKSNRLYFSPMLHPSCIILVFQLVALDYWPPVATVKCMTEQVLAAEIQ